jgi:hypothetical protein
VVVRARNFMYCTDHHVLKGQWQAGGCIEPSM